MPSFKSIASLFLSATLSAGIFAADAPAKPETKDVEPIMTLKGKELFQDSFSKAEIEPGWKIAKGKWSEADGMISGVELPADLHAAVIRRDLASHNLIIQISVALKPGAKTAAVILNNEKGHVCRLTMNPNGFAISKDKPNAKSDEKGVVLQKVEFPLKPGEWHTFLMEIQGTQIIARTDADHVAFGENAGIDVNKTSLGLVSAGGEGAGYANLKVWEAQPNPAWDASKQKLTHSVNKAKPTN